jgi:hypothetical protein
MKQTLKCHYSVPKQMGRPRKRRKVPEGSQEGCQLSTACPNAPISKENGPSTDNDPGGSALEMISHNLYPEPAVNFTGSEAPLLLVEPAVLTDAPLSDHLALFGNAIDDVDSDESPPFDSPMTPSLSAIADSFPSTLDWTDFSSPPDLPTTVTNLPSQKTSASDHSTSIPTPLPPTHHYPHVSVLTPPSTSPLALPPPCTCLPDLYLALSDLSTHSSHPVSRHTVEILQTAARTAHAVLYCRICPQNFQSSMQNVMLLGALLGVIADSWSRILRAPARDLARAFYVDPATSLPSNSDLDASWTDTEEKEWKLFAHYLVRQYVSGDAPPPSIHIPCICPMLSSSSSSFQTNPPIIILNNLCNAMERRQKSWHRLEKDTGEFPPRYDSTDALARPGEGSCTEEQHELGRMTEMEDEKEYPCMKIVASVRSVMARVNRRPGS